VAFLGFAAALLALLLWTAPLGPAWIEAVVAALFAVGAALSFVGISRSPPARRRLAVIALGCNAFGLFGLLILYVVG
jgi:hypothetical protein